MSLQVEWHPEDTVRRRIYKRIEVIGRLLGVWLVEKGTSASFEWHDDGSTMMEAVKQQILQTLTSSCSQHSSTIPRALKIVLNV